MFWSIFQQIVKTISTKHLNHQHLHFTFPSQRNPMFHEVFPPNPPLRPRPPLFFESTTAFASRSRSTTASWPKRAAKCSGVLPREPRPEAKPQAEPKRRGEKLWKNFGASKVKVLEILWIFRKPFANVHISRKVPFAHVWQIYGPRSCKTFHDFMGFCTALIYFILFRKSKSMSRKRHNRDHNEQQKMLVQVSWHTGHALSIRSDKQNPRNTWTINISSTSSQRSHASRGFPPQILLRGHGAHCSVHPRPPSPRGAAGPWNRGRSRLPNAAVFCLRSRGQAAGRTQQNEGEKNSETILVPQKSKFGNCCHSNSPWIWRKLWIWDVSKTSSWLKKAVSTTVAVQMIWYHHPPINLNGPASFSKKQYISAGCIQTIIRIMRIPPSSQSMAQQNGTKLLQAIACHCITKVSGWSSNIFEARAFFICLLHGVHVTANQMSYGSYFIFLGCFQDVTTSDPIQVKDL